MDLSVIIPCHNVEAFVEQCLDSVTKQLSDGVELIVIDDASTDGTWARLKKYQSINSVRLVGLQQNLGLGAVRNLGIQMSRGKYLLFLDSDDWLVDGAIAKLRDCSASHSPDLVFFDHVRMHPNLGAIESPHARLFDSFAESAQSYADKLRLLDFPPMACFKLYRRAFVVDSGVVFGKGHYEDVSWSYPLTVMANSIQMLPEALYCYRQRKGSILSEQNQRHMDLIAEYDKIFAHCEAFGDEDYRSKIIAKAVAHYLFVLFIRSDRLSWRDLKEFFTRAHAQISGFDAEEVSYALSTVSVNPIKREVLLRGSLFSFALSFGVVKISRLIKSPIFFYRTLRSRRG